MGDSSVDRSLGAALRSMSSRKYLFPPSAPCTFTAYHHPCRSGCPVFGKGRARTVWKLRVQPTGFRTSFGLPNKASICPHSIMPRSILVRVSRHDRHRGHFGYFVTRPVVALRTSNYIRPQKPVFEQALSKDPSLANNTHKNFIGRGRLLSRVSSYI